MTIATFIAGFIVGGSVIIALVRWAVRGSIYFSDDVGNP